jgi:hypothetical protein
VLPLGPAACPAGPPASFHAGVAGRSSAILRWLAMPKMKSHSGAKKRFKLTGTGKVQGHHAFTSHILEKK